MTVPDAGTARPCPFCGCRTITVVSAVVGGFTNISCSECRGGLAGPRRDVQIARWNRRTPAPVPWRESEAVRAARSRCYTLIVHPDSTVEVEDAALDALCDAVASCGTGGESKEPYLLSCPWCQCDLKTESVIQQVSHLIACGDRYRAKFPAAPTPSGEPGEASVTEAMVDAACRAYSDAYAAWSERERPGVTVVRFGDSPELDNVQRANMRAALLAGRSGSAPTPSGEAEA